MAKIIIEAELCKSCRFCIGACPLKIVQVGSETNTKGYKVVEQINSEKCTGCRLCAIICPEAAIEVFK